MKILTIFFKKKPNIGECLLPKNYQEDILQGAGWGKMWRAINLNRNMYIHIYLCISSYMYVYVHIKVKGISLKCSLLYQKKKNLWPKTWWFLFSVFPLFSIKLSISIYQAICLSDHSSSGYTSDVFLRSHYIGKLAKYQVIFHFS